MKNLTGKLATSGAALIAAIAANDASAQTAYNWSGFYVGAHAGYGWGQSDSSIFGKSKDNGIAAGLQAGYNWQLSSLVIGAEIDGSFSEINGKPDAFFEGKTTMRLRHREDWSGTARLKVGLPLNGVPVFNNMLIYGTGGVAMSRWTSTLNGETTFLGIPFPFGGKESNTHFGWTVGAGVEMPITSRLSLKLEYLRTDYGKKKYKYDFEDDVTVKIDHEVNTVRMGLNYRFGTW